MENEESLEKIKNIENDNRKAKFHNILFHILAIVCISLFCVAISPKTLQNDTYYTISIGEYIYNNGVSDLTQDIYSWHNLPYTYPHWLYDLMIFVIYNSFGHFGIYCSTMIFAAILGIVIYALANKKSKNKLISFIVTIGAIYLIKDFIAARAQLVTFVLFGLTVLFIEMFLEAGKKRHAIPLIIIPLLIANLHCAVFPFYFVLFLPYIAEFLIEVVLDWNLDIKLYKLFFKIKKKITKDQTKKELFDSKLKKLDEINLNKKEKRAKIRENPYKVKVTKNYTVLLLIAVMGIAMLTGFLNPAGDGAYTYLPKTLEGTTMNSINEHLPLTLANNFDFSITLVIFLLILIFTDTKIKLSDLFMLCGMTFLALKTRRQVSMFAIFCGPILATLISQLIAKYDRNTFKKIEDFMSGWYGSVVVTCCFIILATNMIKPRLDDEYVNKTDYPVEASNWILSNLDVENIKLFNEYNFGSYLLFRGIPVFIDSRCDLYSPEFNRDLENGIEGRDIFSEALDIDGLALDYKKEFEEYGVTHAILYDNAKLAMILESDSNYKKIYDQGNFKIFERLDAKEK